MRRGTGTFVAALAAVVVAACGGASAWALEEPGTILRSFPSPLGIGTHGVAFDLDEEHIWINSRGGPLGEFAQIDFHGIEVPLTRHNTPSTVPQGFEMNAAGELWLIDRSTNSERAMRMNTSGALLSSFPLRLGPAGPYLDNPNDLTLGDGDLYVVAPNDPAMHRFQQNGTYVETIDLYPAIDPAYPFNDAIAYDGKNFWLAFGTSVPTPASRVYEVAPDGKILSSFLFETRIAGLSYHQPISVDEQPVADDEQPFGAATDGYLGDTIYLFAIPEPATAALVAVGMLIGLQRRRIRWQA